MNLKQLSNLLGYSVSTISKAFSGSTEISETTKNIIIAKSKELGIYSKYSKQKFEKKVIAVIIPELEGDYYTKFAVTLNKLINEKNYTMTLSVTNFSSSVESDLIRFHSTNGRADGIIVVDANTKSKKYSSPPIIYINSENEDDSNADYVNTNFYPGVLDAIRFFKENGHKKIAFIGESLTKDKYLCYKKAMEQCKLEVDSSLVCVDKARFEEAGYLGIKKLFDSGNMPTAILSGYDYIALGIIHFLEEHSLKVPDDVSIVGIDDIQFASYHKIALSSIKVNVEHICEICMAILTKKINNPLYKVCQSVKVKSEFVNRKSVKNLLK